MFAAIVALGLFAPQDAAAKHPADFVIKMKEGRITVSGLVQNRTMYEAQADGYVYDGSANSLELIGTATAPAKLRTPYTEPQFENVYRAEKIRFNLVTGKMSLTNEVKPKQ